MIRGWTGISWHLGMEWNAYLELPLYDRWVLHDELNELIQNANEAGAPHPKDMK